MARILIGNIKGPKGDTGPRGPQGATGPQGPQGPLPPLVNNALATEAGVSALDAAMGKTLQDQITQNTQGITQLNSNKLQCYSFEQMTAKMSLSETQAILDIVQTTDNTRFQLIFNFSGKKLAVSYFNGSSWSQKDLATWT